MKLDGRPKGRAATPARFLAWQIQRQGPVAVDVSDPERFTAALPKGRRKVAFIDYLRNQRPVGASTRPLQPRSRGQDTAAIDGPSHWHIGDAAELVRRELEAFAG